MLTVRLIIAALIANQKIATDLTGVYVGNCVLLIMKIIEIIENKLMEFKNNCE